MNKPKVIAIVGPTASGKSSLGIDLSKHLNGEVISADSRQVYRGLDIATGKVTTKEMSGVPHHLLDITDPDDVYTAADFKRDAQAAISDIVKRDKVPIIVGGTSFYVELLRGRMQAAPVEPNQAFRDSIAHHSDEELFKQLEAMDPERASSIDPHNRRRLVRALEIINELGSVPESKPVESDYEWLILGINLDKDTLHKNIHQRLLSRLDAGMIAEAESLHKNGLSYKRMDELGLEYRYLAQFLQNQITEVELSSLIETKDRQYAKRQLTWLKRDEEIIWVNPDKRADIFRLADTFLADN